MEEGAAAGKDGLLERQKDFSQLKHIIMLSNGDKFKFPDGDGVFTFIESWVDAHGEPIVKYRDLNGKIWHSAGYYVSDLMLVM